MRLDEQYCIGPDNGLFSFLFAESRSKEIRQISNSQLFMSDPHPTFHGRDVFAPVAAHLSLGISFESIGPLVEDPVMLGIPNPRDTDHGIEGEVIHIDRFGNLTSNIEERMLSRHVDSVQVAGRQIRGINEFFSEVPTGSPVALINSFGFLEIAINMGNASLDLAAGKGSRVQVIWSDRYPA